MKFAGRLIILVTAITIAVETQAVPAPDTTQSAEAESIEEVIDDDRSGFKLTGLYRDLSTLQKVNEYYGAGTIPGDGKTLAANLKRVRLTPEFSSGNTFTAHADFDSEAIFSNYGGSREFDAYWRISEYNDFLNMCWEAEGRGNPYYRAKLHRAWIKFNTPGFALTAGRQQVRFGSGRLWNPLDILNPVSPTLIEGAEEQKGSDVLRTDFYFTRSTELTLIANPMLTENRYRGMDRRDSNYAARFKIAALDTDFAVLGGWISHRAVAGADISAEFLDGVLRAGVIHSRPDGYDSYTQAGGGYEYTFAGGISILAEYFYNQNGLNFNKELRAAYLSGLAGESGGEQFYLLSNQFITFNRHYLGVALGYDFHPLVRNDFFVIIDFGGRGLCVNESLKYNIFQNTDIVAGALFGRVFDGSRRGSDFDQFAGSRALYYLHLSFYF